VAGQEGEQVYIQIGDEEMEMLTQQQAEQVRLMLLDSCNSDENTCGRVFWLNLRLYASL